MEETMPDNKIKLPELPRRLREEFNLVVSYRQVYGAVLDGTIPAERDPSGSRWQVTPNDLPLIAEKLGHRADTPPDLEFVG